MEGILESFYRDIRKKRYIRESCITAAELSGCSCSNCGSTNHVFRVLGEDLCEDCIDKVQSLCKESTGLPAVEDINGQFLLDTLNEAVVFFDLAKMQKEADAKFGGDIKKLCKSYKCSAYKIFADKIDFQTATTSSGKSRINQLMIDFDGEFATEKSANSMPADPDGTKAPYVVHGKGAMKAPSTATATATAATATVPKGPAKASTTTVTKASSTSSVSNVSATSNAQNTQTVKGNPVTQLEFTVGKNIKVELTYVKDVGGKCEYEVVVGGKKQENNEYFKKECLAEKSLTQAVIEDMATYAFSYFSNATGDGVIISKKYGRGTFEFKVLVDTKARNKLYLLPVIGQKEKNDLKFEIEDKVLLSSVVLNAKITGWIDSYLNDKFPVFFDKRYNPFKTDFGNATFTPDEVWNSKTTDIDVTCSWAGHEFVIGMETELASKADSASDYLKHELLNHLFVVIPDFMEKKFKSAKHVNMHDFTLDTSDTEVYAELKAKDFYDKGSLIFDVVFTDKNTGIVSHEDGVKFKGKSMQEFLEKLNKELSIKHNVGVDHSTATGITFNSSLSTSATEKMKNASKRAVLMAKIANSVKKILDSRGVRDGNGGKYRDYDLDFSDFIVDDIGAVRGMTLIVYPQESTDYESLAKGFADSIKEIYGVKVETKVIENDDSDTGYAITMEIPTNQLADFSKGINLGAFEGTIMELTTSICESTGNRYCNLAE